MNFSAKGAIKCFLMCHVTLSSVIAGNAAPLERPWAMHRDSQKRSVHTCQINALDRMARQLSHGWDRRTGVSQSVLTTRILSVLILSTKAFCHFIFSHYKKESLKTLIANNISKLCFSCVLYRELKRVKACIWKGETRQKRPSKLYFLLNSLLDSLACTFLSWKASCEFHHQRNFKGKRELLFSLKLFYFICMCLYGNKTELMRNSWMSMWF